MPRRCSGRGAPNESICTGRDFYIGTRLVRDALVNQGGVWAMKRQPKNPQTEVKTKLKPETKTEEKMIIAGGDAEIIEKLVAQVTRLQFEVKHLKRQLKEAEHPETNLFKRRIAELGLRHVDIALKLNIDPAAVSHLVSRKRQLRAMEVIPFAEILQVEPMDILKFLVKDMHERISNGGVRWG